jgi:hypothetical protein
MRLALVVGVLGLAMGHAAMADTITYDQNNVDYTISPSDGVLFKVIPPAFDASLGTLTGVTFTVIGDATYTLYGETGDSTVFPATFTNTGYMYGVGVALTTGGIPLAPSTAFGTTQQITEGIHVDMSATVSADALQYYLLAGDGEFDFSAFGVATDSETGQVVHYNDDEEQFAGNVVETYTFTPVPEPGTLALLLSGVFGMIGLARIRRRI